MQLMQGVVPSLQALSREGEYGRNKINQYTRYLTVPMAMLQAYGFLALLNSQGVLTGQVRSRELRDDHPDRDADRRGDRPDVDRRADHRAGDRQRHQLHHLRGHRQPGAGRAQRLPHQPEPDAADRLRARRHRCRRGDHLHPGRPAPDPDPVRQPGPRPADVFGRPDVPAAARQPGRRHPDHLRGEHPAVPRAAGARTSRRPRSRS